jgi:ABC-2 type transport system permease protein
MMLAYTWLEAKRQFRNRENLVWRLALPAGVYLLLIMARGGPQPEREGIAGGDGAMVAMAAFGAVAAGLFATGPALAQERAGGWLRQLRTTPMTPAAAVVAKIAVAMAYALPAIALVAATGRAVDAVDLGLAQWGELIGLMWIGSAPFAALGVAIGLAIKNADAAYTATNLAFIVLWLLGGIFTRPDSMPDVLAAFSRNLPSNGLIEVGWSLIGTGGFPVSDAALLAGWTAGAGLLAAIAWRRIGGAR